MFERAALSIGLGGQRIELCSRSEAPPPFLFSSPLPNFRNHPRNIRLDLPRRIINPQYMFLGDNVWLGPGSLLLAVIRYPTSPMQNPELKLSLQHFSPKIEIGNRVPSKLICRSLLIVKSSLKIMFCLHQTFILRMLRMAI